MANSDRFSFDELDQLSQCVFCDHWSTNGRCTAFPRGVPVEILTNKADHRQPYAGDNGIHFEYNGGPLPLPDWLKE